jgi:hypothetical protein
MERNTVTKTISKRPTGVFYVDGNKAFYFEQALASPIALEIPIDIISNFELLNKKKLMALIQAFIKNNKLFPKNIVILLSVRVTFDREFPHGLIEMQKNIQEFLELVPYEEIIEKKIISSGKTKVVATNKEICEAIKSTFIISGFIVSGIYPLSLSIESIPQLKTNLDLSLFVNKLPDLKAINLQPVVEASYPASYGSPSAAGKEKSGKTRTYALSGIFAVLMLVLGFVVYTSVISPPKVKTSNILPKPSITRSKPTGVQQTIPATSEIDVSTISSETNISTKSSTTGSF